MIQFIPPAFKSSNIEIERVVNFERMTEYAKHFDFYWRGGEQDEACMENIAEVAFARFMSHPSQLQSYLAIDKTTNKMVGFANLNIRFNTATYQKECYLADLYVTEEYRRLGIAKGLIEFAVNLSSRECWHRLFWITRLENIEAQALYDQVASKKTHVWYEIDID